MSYSNLSYALLGLLGLRKLWNRVFMPRSYALKFLGSPDGKETMAYPFEYYLVKPQRFDRWIDTLMQCTMVVHLTYKTNDQETIKPHGTWGFGEPLFKTIIHLSMLTSHIFHSPELQRFSLFITNDEKQPFHEDARAPYCENYFYSWLYFVILLSGLPYSPHGQVILQKCL